MTTRTNISLIMLLMLFGYSIQSAANGETVYQQNCMACHGEGVAGAPKLAEASAWKSRLQKGIDAMVTIVVDGVQGYSGTMPPRGGNPDLSDEQIRMAVQYMLDQLP